MNGSKVKKKLFEVPTILDVKKDMLVRVFEALSLRELIKLKPTCKTFNVQIASAIGKRYEVSSLTTKGKYVLAMNPGLTYRFVVVSNDELCKYLERMKLTKHGSKIVERFKTPLITCTSKVVEEKARKVEKENIEEKKKRIDYISEVVSIKG